MKSPVRTQLEAKFSDMFAQSTLVLTQPNPATFERFEKRGGTQQAFTYVALAAVVSAVIAGLFALMPWHNQVGFFGQFFTQLITIPLSFLVFTGAVYLIGKNLFKGTGTYPEVAYTFALFFVPLSIISTLIGVIPVLGVLVSLLIGLAMVYFGYLAVQSSMNIRDQAQAIGTLVLSWIASFIIAGLVATPILAIFAIGRAATGN